MKNFSFYMPTRIIFGENEISNIARYLEGKKTILITSKGFSKRGLAQKIKANSSDIIAVFDEVKSHPEFKDLEKMHEKIYKYDFDQILAIGGGSVMDASKFFCVYDESKNAKSISKLIKEKKAKKDFFVKDLICVPTTAGTGSELTPWASIWDMDERKKYSLHLESLHAKLAIYDPNLTLSLPKDTTIQTALDSLSHAFESMWNKNANKISLTFALKSIKLTLKYLPLLANDLQNIKYRKKIMLSCMYSALAFSNTQTAIAHAMSYFITAHKGIPHGLACSFSLPYVFDVALRKKGLKKRFKPLKNLDLREFLSSLGVSYKFSDYKLTKEDIKKLKSSVSSTQRGQNSLINVHELDF